MDLRPLPGTALRVSPLGLGTVKLGRDRGVKYPTPVRIPDDDEALALLRLARDLGINLVDTAPAYGTSEERLGRLLRGWRDQWVIVTKAGEEFDGQTSRFDFSPRGIRASVERSLARLGTDRLDVVLLHSAGDDESLLVPGGAMDALRALQREGKVLAVGASTKTPAGGVRAAELGDVVMLTLNAEAGGDRPAIAAARARGTCVLIKKGLASGHALGAGPGALDQAMRLVLGEPGVTSLIVGTTNPQHLRDNVDAARRALRGEPGAGLS